jgi:hypothetical protein
MDHGYSAWFKQGGPGLGLVWRTIWGSIPEESVAFGVVNHLIMIEEVYPHNGFFLKPWNDLDKVGLGVVSNLNFNVVGPHGVEVLHWPLNMADWVWVDAWVVALEVKSGRSRC